MTASRKFHKQIFEDLQFSKGLIDMQLQSVNPASLADYLVTVDGLGEIYFTECSPLEETFKRPKFADGLSARMQTAQTGTSEVTDVTLSVIFDPDKHGALIDWIEQRKDGSFFQVLIRPVIRSKEVQFRGQRAFRLADCRLMKSSYPGNISSESGEEVSKISITFSVNTISYAS